MSKYLVALVIALAAFENQVLAAGTSASTESEFDTQLAVADRLNKASFLDLPPAEARHILMPRLRTPTGPWLGWIPMENRVFSTVLHSPHQTEPQPQVTEEQAQYEFAQAESTEAIIEHAEHLLEGGSYPNMENTPPSIHTVSPSKPDENSCNCETIQRAVNKSPDECIDYCVWKGLQRDERRQNDAKLREDGTGGWVNGMGESLRGELDREI